MSIDWENLPYVIEEQAKKSSEDLAVLLTIQENAGGWAFEVRRKVQEEILEVLCATLDESWHKSGVSYEGSYYYYDLTKWKYDEKFNFIFFRLGPGYIGLGWELLEKYKSADSNVAELFQQRLRASDWPGKTNKYGWIRWNLPDVRCEVSSTANIVRIYEQICGHTPQSNCGEIEELQKYLEDIADRFEKFMENFSRELVLT